MLGVKKALGHLAKKQCELVWTFVEEREWSCLDNDI